MLVTLDRPSVLFPWTGKKHTARCGINLPISLIEAVYQLTGKLMYSTSMQGFFFATGDHALVVEEIERQGGAFAPFDIKIGDITRSAVINTDEVVKIRPNYFFGIPSQEKSVIQFRSGNSIVVYAPCETARSRIVRARNLPRFATPAAA